MFPVAPTDSATIQALQNLPESSKLRKLCELIKEKGNSALGHVPKSEVTDELPPVFLDIENDCYSVYTAVQYIKSHPENEELKVERKFITENKVPLEASSNADYIASCLWVLYQCCGSTGHKKLLSRPHYMSELMKHMLFGESMAVQTIAFKTLSVLLSECHDLDTVEIIWTHM